MNNTENECKNKKFWIVSYSRDDARFSEAHNYPRLRYVVNGVIGFAFSTALYFLAWKRLNFADFDPNFGMATQLFIIFGIAFVFAHSPVREISHFSLQKFQINIENRSNCV